MEELSKQAELPQLVNTGGSHGTALGPKIPLSKKPVDKALDYAALKDALLKMYDVTEDGFKRRFRSCRPEPGDTFIQFSVRLDSYFKRWIEMAHTDTTYKSLYDLIMRDQFLHICSKDLSLFLKERIPDSLGKMVALADQYREAKYTSASNLINKVKLNARKEQRSKPAERTSFIPVRDRKCLRCGKTGHIALDCRVNLQKTSSALSEDKKNFKGKICNTCTIPTDSIEDAISTGCTSTLPSSCQSITNVSMPVSSGHVDGKPVTVLRDTCCSSIVVKRDMVDNESLTGGKQVCILADGTRVEAPIARIAIDTQYLQGKFEGWCMANPVYDLIIGNIGDARDPGKPDPSWQHTGDVETREQVRNKIKSYVQLKVKDIITDEVNSNDIKKAQLEDTTLDKIRRYVLTGDTVASKNGTVKLILKRGMIYRQFSTSKHNKVSCTQLVVPKSYRETVTRLAHESIMSGHMGTQRTLARVLSAFYWPGVSAGVKRTVPKGKIDLVYGKQVREPMAILKELWTKEMDDPEVKSTYQYVIDLRERLDATCELA
ncbi:unnamed protein product [Mytilus coruscus]|uniref:CCHC-type domain-containing protein n=1 Tax=Mytilus coruscus TaxID=42192 RepID=A0A6J8B229_MYTCO|nr:unnamed protein product [Mytilus coruscus]